VLTRLRAIHVSPARTRSATNTIAYGAHDQLPVNVADPEPDVAAQPLERLDGLLLEVRDDQLSKFLDRLLR
jgi:hypothetical protein